MKISFRKQENKAAIRVYEQAGFHTHNEQGDKAEIGNVDFRMMIIRRDNLYQNISLTG